MRHFLSAFLAAVLLGAPFVNAAEPLYTYEGDGLTIRVLTLSADETTVTGEIVRGDSVWPFTGRNSEAGGVETTKGTFTVGKDSYPFTAEHREGAKALTFVTDGVTYKLTQRGPADAAKPQAAGTVKFTTAEFRDINMGNVVSHTMLIPEGFTPEGHIEWSNDRTPYPQKKIKVIAADKSQITFQPAMSFLYWDWTDLAKAENARNGFNPPAGDQGMPPPQDLAAWLMTMVAKNKGVTNVKLVRDERDAAAEAVMAQTDLKNPNAGGTKWEVHLIQFTYDLDGVPFTEEVSFTYSQTAPSFTRNMTTWIWMLFTNSAIRSPSANWQQMRPVMYTSVASLRTVPQWFTQSQLLIMEITLKNHQVTMDDIKRRAAEYDKMTDQQMADWKKGQVIDDKKQDERINRIYEVSNFAGPDGSVRKLPNGFKHYYSDGKGGFRMSNNEQPPEAGWNPVEPMK